MHIHIYQIYGKCAGCKNYAHCTHMHICSTTQRGKCLSGCTERVLQQLNTFLLSLQTGQKTENIFNPRQRRRGGRGSTDSEANSRTTRRRAAVWSFGALAF